MWGWGRVVQIQSIYVLLPVLQEKPRVPVQRIGSLQVHVGTGQRKTGKQWLEEQHVPLVCICADQQPPAALFSLQEKLFAAFGNANVSYERTRPGPTCGDPRRSAVHIHHLRPSTANVLAWFPDAVEGNSERDAPAHTGTGATWD